MAPHKGYGHRLVRAHWFRSIASNADSFAPTFSVRLLPIAIFSLDRPSPSGRSDGYRFVIANLFRSVMIDCDLFVMENMFGCHTIMEPKVLKVTSRAV
jgi:hypothetical protein